MRTVIIIIAGFVLLGIFAGVARMRHWRPATTTTAFVAVWLVIAAVNMWTGVAQAGYSFMEELPIFLVILLIPAAAAVLLQRKRS